MQLFSASENVSLWDIGGMCVGYIKKGNLHIGHRKVIRKEEKENGIKKELFEYPIDDFLILNCEDPKLPKEEEEPKEEENSILKPIPTQNSKYFHIMIECIVEKEDRFIFSLSPRISERRCFYTITQNIYIDFKKVQVDNYEKKTNKHSFSCAYNSEKTIDEIKRDWRAEHSEATCTLGDDELREYYKRKYWLESLPSLRIGYFKPKPKMPYIFRKDKRPIYTRENDLTDYSWTSYDFVLSHLMLFEGILPKLERYYLREYGVYPIKHLPTKMENVQGSQGSQGGGSSGDNQGYNSNGYLGIVNITIEKKKPSIKTLRCGDRMVIANKGEFILMAIDCEDFKAGHLYKWNGKEWIELTPFIQYLQEAKDAFNDIKQLPKVAQNYFYKEFATFGIAICNGLFSSTVMTDALTVIGNVSMMGLPEIDPHKKGALYTRNGALRISLG